MNASTHARILTVAFALLSGCSVLERDSYKYEKPLVAVASFENRVRFPFDWQLGDNISKLLTDSLYQTEQFRVLDREDLGAVLSEQDLQATGRTRAEQRVRQNRLKNAHYLITGVVTEFAHVSMSGLDFGVGSLRIFGGGNHAIVNIALKMTEVESGEVVFTRVIDGKAYAGEVEVGALYKQVAFGGYHFFKTPLGRALHQALNKAVSEIQDRIGKRLWRPAIAGVDGDRVTLSGGQDRRMMVGNRWIVRKRGEPVVDPHTGDVLGHGSGEDVGKVRVTRVYELYSEGVIESGEGIERGLRLEPVAEVPVEIEAEKKP